MQAGKSSIQFEHPPIITSAASIVGQTEGEGPLASFLTGWSRIRRLGRVVGGGGE
ncbi:MAG: hypothetical protein ACLR8P_12675 [Clostridium fessum]